MDEDKRVGRWAALSWPEQGEYVSTTFFVTDANLRLRVPHHDIRLDRFVVMTDGLERLAIGFAAAAPHAPFLDGVCRPRTAAGGYGRDAALSRGLGVYLDSDAVNQHTDDDKTVILAALP